MGGGLMQLVAYGAQDVYLTGNPQITFFKTIYRRYTNFSMECIRQTFSGTVAQAARVVATITRNGDLIYDCHLKVTNNSDSVSGYNPGHNIIDNIEVEIGGQVIDRHYGHWMEAHAELTEPSYGFTSISDIVSDLVTGQTMTALNQQLSPFQLSSGAGGVNLKDSDPGDVSIANLYIPLRFWFNRDVGLALPLIALQYHEVKINLTLTNYYKGDDLTNHGGKNLSDVELWCNYIYLDTDERRRFAQVSHEYLIEQVQHAVYDVSDSVDKTLELNFNHPVKELIWVPIDTSSANNWGDAGKSSGLFDPTIYNNDNSTNVKLILNGHGRFEKQNIDYFTRYQPMKYHTSQGKGKSFDTIAVYSFCLKPEEHQPSGTCNFSRIDDVRLEIKSMEPNPNTDLHIYAVNYNVLRIMSGMGGLAYSN
jgi:hypothetical protein